MNGWIPKLCLALATSLPLAAFASVSNWELHVDQPRSFTKESTNVLFTAKAPETLAGSPKFSVVRIDDTGKVVQTMGIASDDGVMGDRKAGDKIFSRKIVVYAKKKGTFYYTLVEENADGTLPAQVAQSTPRVAVEVMEHPTLMGVLKQVFKQMNL